MLPLITEARSNLDLPSWFAQNRDSVDKDVLHHGAVLLRGFDMSSEAQFATFVEVFSGHRLDYIYRSTPRTETAPGIYTATEYLAGQVIPQHNENAFQRDWPMRLVFFCLYPADGGGGETPLAHSARVTERIDPHIRKKFLEKGVMYIRNYGGGIDLPWQTVFQTESAADVELYCRNHDIDFEWTSSDRLRTRQVCQGLAIHPSTRKTVWFNQAHLFHPSNLTPATRHALCELLKSEDNFPRNSRYGDGTPFKPTELENIREAFRQETNVFSWKAGDVLLIDNMLVSHGRNPYKGKRRVLTAMCDPFSLSQPAPSLLTNEHAL
jgi:alpha-ketoglutarate-dependent taurine dioxygenase